MPKLGGPVTRQKERITAILQAMSENERERSRLEIQLSEANAALAQMTGRRKQEPVLELEGERT